MLAIGSDLESLLGGLVRGLSTREMVAALCAAGDTEFSWRHFLLVEHAGRVIAGLCRVSTDARRSLTRALPRRLQRDCGLGPSGLLRLLARSIRHALATRGPEPPPSSLYIPVGAVHPEYQRTGVATQTLRHVIAHAAEDGFESVCLYVQTSNRQAVALYDSLGFRASPPRRKGKKLMVLSCCRHGGTYPK